MEKFIKLLSIMMILSLVSVVFPLNACSEGDKTTAESLPHNFSGPNHAASSNNICVITSGHRIRCSTDGVNWVVKNSNTDKSISDIIWTGSEFIAVGEKGLILVSPDADKWTVKDSKTAFDLNRIIFNGKIFVATGGDYNSKKGVIITSNDGEDWTIRSKSDLGNINIAAYNNKFLAVGYKDVGEPNIKSFVLVSDDGINWSEGNLPSDNTPWHVSVFKENFVIPGNLGGGSGKIYTSKDGITWNSNEVPSLAFLIENTLFSNDKYLIISGRYGAFAYSEDIENGWIHTNLDSIISNPSEIMKDEIILGLTEFKGKYIGIVNNGSIISTEDIKVWTRQVVFQPWEIEILLDGKPIQFDVPPIVENGRVIVPIRSIFEALGANIEWNSKTRTVNASLKGKNISLKLNSKSALINGKVVSLDVPAKIIDNRTFVQLRFISENFGAAVNWDNVTKTVSINTKK